MHQVTQGEFVRHLKSNKITKVIAQESVKKPDNFVVVAIDGPAQQAYAMRHGRVNELRTWELINLGKFLKKHGIPVFETQQNVVKEA